MEIDIAAPAGQEQFALIVGISQQRVGQLVAEGVLMRDGTVADWLLAYCERLREMAAGRGQALTTERAALARSQRRGQDIKNAVAEKEYAPIGLLEDVLAAVSSSVVDRLDALSGDLARKCPQLDDDARSQVAAVIASARNEWVRGTASLSTAILDQLVADDDEPGVDVMADDLGDIEP